MRIIPDRSRRRASLGALLLLVTVPSWAQTNAEVNAGIQFNFSLPGARSLGLGGAFLGLADDATAAYANPAGLINLSTPEVSLEARHWQFSNVFTDRGRLTGDPTGQGVDTVRGLRPGESNNDEVGASFFSIVYPAGHWGIALYRHQLAQFDAGFETQGAVLASSPSFVSRIGPARNSLQLDIANLGLSASYRVNEWFSVGAGVSYYEFEISSRTLRYDFANGRIGDESGTAPGAVLGPPSFRDDNVFAIDTQRGEEGRLALNAGFLWQIGGNWRAGGVYRHGPEFEFETEYRSGPRQPDAFVRRDARFNIPDVMGIGLSYQPNEFATFNLDYARIEYSELTSHFTDIFPRKGDPDERELRRFRVDDGGEIHLGFEYLFEWPKWLLATRFGAWHDPDHKIRYEGSDNTLRALFQGGDDETHYTAGLGYLGNKFQVDAAFDFSDRVSTASLSTVVRF